MSDNINNDMQLAPFNEDLGSIDWAALQDDVLQEPCLFNEYFDWNAYQPVGQGAQALAGDR